MIEATGIQVGDRVLSAGRCDCGVVIGYVVNGKATNGQFLKIGEKLVCSTCRDRADRKANGWTPANSVD